MARNVGGRMQRPSCLDPQKFDRNGMARRFVEQDPEDEKVSYFEWHEGCSCYWPEEEIFFGRRQQSSDISCDSPLEVDEDPSEEEKDEILPSVHGKMPLRATVPPTTHRRLLRARRQHTDLVRYLACAEV